MKPSLWESFREELVATAMVLVVTTAGSFYFLQQMAGTKEVQQSPEPTTSPAKEIVQGMVKVLGEQEEAKEVGGETIPTPEPTSGPTLTPDPYQTEVIYGVGGLYDYEEYRLELNNPRLTFDARGSSGRKMVIDAVIENKKVARGLQTQFTAQVIKDGNVIVPAAALSANVVKIVLPGERQALTLRIALIESTDVKRIDYKPDGAPMVSHLLLP